MRTEGADRYVTRPWCSQGQSQGEGWRQRTKPASWVPPSFRGPHRASAPALPCPQCSPALSDLSLPSTLAPSRPLTCPPSPPHPPRLPSRPRVSHRPFVTPPSVSTGLTTHPVGGLCPRAPLWPPRRESLVTEARRPVTPCGQGRGMGLGATSTWGFPAVPLTSWVTG